MTWLQIPSYWFIFFGSLFSFFFLLKQDEKCATWFEKKNAGLIENDLGSSTASIIKSHKKMCRDLTDGVV